MPDGDITVEEDDVEGHIDITVEQNDLPVGIANNQQSEKVAIKNAPPSKVALPMNKQKIKYLMKGSDVLEHARNPTLELMLCIAYRYLWTSITYLYLWTSITYRYSWTGYDGEELMRHYNFLPLFRI